VKLVEMGMEVFHHAGVASFHVNLKKKAFSYWKM
jgi:hypothetical protein